MMKNTLKAIFLVLIICSCKKNRTCTCNVNMNTVNTATKNDGSAPVSSTSTYSHVIVSSDGHASMKTAQITLNCYTRTEVYSNSNTVYSGTLTTVKTSDHTDDYNCSLK